MAASKMDYQKKIDKIEQQDKHEKQTLFAKSQTAEVAYAQILNPNKKQRTISQQDFLKGDAAINIDKLNAPTNTSPPNQNNKPITAIPNRYNKAIREANPTITQAQFHEMNVGDYFEQDCYDHFVSVKITHINKTEHFITIQYENGTEMEFCYAKSWARAEFFKYGTTKYANKWEEQKEKDDDDWDCTICTFINSGSNKQCEICETPKTGPVVKSLFDEFYETLRFIFIFI